MVIITYKKSYKEHSKSESLLLAQSNKMT